MAEDEAKRLMERYSRMSILETIQNAKVHFGNESWRIIRRMYLHPVGMIPEYGRLSYPTRFDSEDVEKYVENAALYQDTLELLEQRKKYVAVEDDFGPTLEELLKNSKTPSFRNLMNTCTKYDTEQNIQVYCAKSQQTYMYFRNQGVSDDDARAYAFAIAFYTGAYCWSISKSVNILARRRTTPTHSEIAKVDDNAAMIMYYLIKGLSHIDSYWGVVRRYLTLNDEDLNDYKPGEIVTWLQFSSSEKSGKTISWFNDHNTVFTIFSLTGRPIKCFSTRENEEDEVVFLPHSSFLVCHVGHDDTESKHHIHLRQVSRFLDIFTENILYRIDRIGIG
jgi:hypothetical protein